MAQRLVQSSTAATIRGPLSAEDERWVARTLHEMSLTQKIGQLFAIWCFGGFASAEDAEYKELLRCVEEKHVGSFVLRARISPRGLLRSQVYPTAMLVNTLQSRARIPLLFAGDFERGAGMRLVEGTWFAHIMALAAAGRPEDAYTMGKITAIEARAAGVPWIYAPVADVNNNPENPIINTRSFGEDPARVSEFVVAFIRGVEENGGLATAKHFPGHGDTAVDSHLDLPTVISDRARLDKIELEPFRAAIAAGVGSIMMAHEAVPALEPDASLPATLSAAITTDLLRHQMGFDGLIVIDALEMRGITNHYFPGEAAVRAVLAGADVLLLPPNLDAAVDAVASAADSGRIPVSRIDDAVQRILRAKAKLGLHADRLTDVDALAHQFHRPEFERAALDISDRGITLLRDDLHSLPLDASKPLRALLIAVSGDSDPYAALDLENEIRWRVDRVDTVRVDTGFARADSVTLPPLETYDVVIAAIFVRVASHKGSVGLPDEQAAFLDRVLATGKPVIVACFGSPYLARRFPAAKAWIAAFTTADVAQRSMGRALFGEVPIGGRLPVNIPGVAKLGAGMDVPANPMTVREARASRVAGNANKIGDADFQAAFRVLDDATERRAFPGGVLAVGHGGDLLVHAFGRQTYDANSPTVNADTIYDAASLTKVVVTTTLAAMEIETGLLSLDAPVARYLPEWNAGLRPDWRNAVTVRHLLAHASGLPAHKHYFLTVRSLREAISQICTEPLEYEPGTQSVYSDLDFMLLGEIIQRVTGQPLDRLARTRIFEPLGMAHTVFNPPASLAPHIAPTENDTEFRQRLVHGEVHDENAWAVGGVAGHAGMFSTAADLSAFCQMLLNGGIYAHQRLLLRSTIAKFTAPQALTGGTRALGWVVPTPGSSGGQYFSARSFGHTGFTGTSMWIDPAQRLFVILLTNRVHPTRANEEIKNVRPALHDAVMAALGLARK